MQKEHCTAIVLAAGSGSRMNSVIQKQYMELIGRPIVYYSLQVFQKSEFIDDIILVVGAGDITFVQDQIVEPYGFTKVRAIVEGGSERYHSVWAGLQTIQKEAGQDNYVFIHDGARPFVDQAMLERALTAVREHQACVLGMPVKDTIKVADEHDYAVKTPERKSLWQVQTPQVFEVSLIEEAYFKLMQEADDFQVTDDAMVVEKMLQRPVKLIPGSYDNIKITTPEDLPVAELYVKTRNLVARLENL